MGGQLTFVYVDGSRLTPWMAYCVARFSAALFAAFGVSIIVTSGIRTEAEQTKIFLERYVTAGNIRGRTVYDTRVWNGVRWYRISAAGTVAVPRTSNHEIQGTKAAVDLRDSGPAPGLTRAGTAIANWARANAHKYGLIPSGYNFKEPWHFDIPDIFRTPPASPAGTIPSTGEDDMPYTPEQLTDIIRNAIVGLRGNDGDRNILDSQKQTRDDIAALAREVSDVGGKVWRNPLTGPDGRTLPAKDYQRYPFDLHRTLMLEMRALNVDALGKLTDAQLDAYVKAAADEQARRQNG